jgi:hypothetical protein
MWLWSVVVGTEGVRIYRAMQHDGSVIPSEVPTGFAERVEQQVCQVSGAGITVVPVLPGEFTNALSLRKSQHAKKNRHLQCTKEKAR